MSNKVIDDKATELFELYVNMLKVVFPNDSRERIRHEEYFANMVEECVTLEDLQEFVTGLLGGK